MLKYLYESKDQIPAGFESLYTERDGKWVLTGVEGLKTPKDVETLQESLRKERTDHAETKTKLKAWGDRDVTATLAELDKIEEYKLAAEGKMDEAKIETLVSSRLNQVKAPLEREISQLKEKNTGLENTNKELVTKDQRRTKFDQLRTEAIAAKVRPEAIDDVLLIVDGMTELTTDGKVITKESAGIVAGLGPKDLFQEMQKTRSYWWPSSTGDGARPGGGGGFDKNPWSREHWNITEQGKAVTADAEKAGRMAASVGSKIGAISPPVAPPKS